MRAALVLAAAAAVVSTGCGTSVRTLALDPAPACSASPTVDPALGRELRALVDDYDLPGAVLLVCTPGGTARAAAGVSDRERHTPMRPADRFPVGEVTQTFVATVILQLAGENRLRLDDTVEHWLPGVVPRGREITVRELLNHTSGLPDVPVARLASRPLDFPPGHDWGFSAANYALLGQIAERASGRSLAANLRGRILHPLGLAHTSLGTGATVRGYDFDHGPPGRDVTTSSFAGLVSDTSDLARFYSALLAGTLLRPAELAEMQTVALAPTGDGLGLFGGETPCGPVWGHHGFVRGYLTYALAGADGAQVVVVATNASNRWTLRALMQLAGDVFCGL